MKTITLFLLKTYKYTLSPIIVSLVGGGCRFQPTCSEYAMQAVSQYGAYKGTKLAIKRILRCHPLSNSANIYDPVPQK